MYRPEMVAEGLSQLDFTEQGLVWCEEREQAISNAVAAIGQQYKRVKQYNLVGKEWGQAVLALLVMSNEALHGSQENAGKQLSSWRAVNAGKYNCIIFVQL